MDRHRAYLIGTAVLSLLNGAAGAVVAMREDLRAEFPGLCTGKSARQDFVTGWGTALSPPLILMVWQAVSILLALQPGRRGTWGIRALMLNGVGFTAGMVGEPITYRVLNPRCFVPAKAAIVVGNIIFPASMVSFGWRLLRFGVVAGQIEDTRP